MRLLRPREPVHFDVSELFARPINTGIQRQERAIIAHWPGGRALVPTVYDPGRDMLVRVPGEAFDILLDGNVRNEPPERTAARLAGLLARAAPLSERPLLLNVELFCDAARAACYRRLCAGEGARVSWLVHDFFPWLNPEWFDQGSARHMMPYLRALRAVPRVCFVSHATRRVFLSRIARGGEMDGPVIAQGADGVGVARQLFAPARRGFLVVGTIEPRKGLLKVIEAFRLLWREGLDAELTIIGRIVDTAQQEAALLAELAAEPRLRYLGSAGDDAVRAEFRRARASITTSDHEGYGLTPLESLFAGVPVIANAAIPSLESIGGEGQIRLSAPDASGIAAAVRGLLDDRAAARLWDQAAQARLPSWRDFTERLADWATAAEEGEGARRASALAA